MLIVTTVGAALLVAPAATLGAGKPPKPPKDVLLCSLSTGVTAVASRSRGVTSWLVTGTSANDVIDCTNSPTGVVLNVVLAEGSDFVWGSQFADTITEQGATTATFSNLMGQGGNDRISAGWGTNAAYSFFFIDGGDGDDTITATGGSGNAHGSAGNDAIDMSLAWNALATGGAGDDVIQGPTWTGCTIDLNNCRNSLHGNDGNDRLIGGPARDELQGGPGTDELRAGAGEDLLIDSGSGSEIFDCGDDANDILQDLDGNGSGYDIVTINFGPGYLNLPEDDAQTGCETVFVQGTAP